MKPKIYIGMLVSIFAVLLSVVSSWGLGIVVALCALQLIFVSGVFYRESRTVSHIDHQDFRADGLSTQDAQREYLTQLQQSFQLQQNVVADEIERVEALINEATSTLEESFKNIYSLTSSHFKQAQSAELDSREIDVQEERNALSVLNEIIDKGVDDVQSITERTKIKTIIEQLDRDNQQLNQRLQVVGQFSTQYKFHLDDAIRAMQFEDVANQSIHSIKHQLTIFSALHEQLQQIKVDDNLLNSDALLSCIQQCENIRQTSKESTKNQAVKQDSLKEGEIELF